MSSIFKYIAKGLYTLFDRLITHLIYSVRNFLYKWRSRLVPTYTHARFTYLNTPKNIIWLLRKKLLRL